MVHQRTTRVAKCRLQISYRALGGRDVAGLGEQAYTANIGNGVLVGVTKGNTFIEVVAADKIQPSADLSTKLRATLVSALAR